MREIIIIIIIIIITITIISVDNDNDNNNNSNSNSNKNNNNNIKKFSTYFYILKISLWRNDHLISIYSKLFFFYQDHFRLLFLQCILFER